MGRYSRGRRGGPAKAVGRETGARVRIPLFPPSILLTYQITFGTFLIGACSYMEPLNKLDDVEKYKNYGILTQPFLNKDYIYNKVITDLKHKQKDINSVYFLASLFLWIKNKVKYSREEEIQKLKFMRTAKEIWESKKASGCTDYAILYATFARTLGIPTTVLHTAEYEWLQRLKNGGDSWMHYGHTFCECFFGGNWVLVDPTSEYIAREYNSEKLELPYKVGGKSVFIPYFRGLDLGEKQNVEAHNKKMDDLCNALEI